MHFITTTTFLALMPALLSSLALGAAVPATDVTALDDVPLGIVAAKPLPIGKSLTKRYSSGQCNIHVHHW